MNEAKEVTFHLFLESQFLKLSLGNPMEEKKEAKSSQPGTVC